MSTSDGDRTAGTLSVTAPVGVEIEIQDARFKPLFAGVSPARLVLPEGVYNITWHAGGRSEERMVRVRSGRTAEEYGGEFPMGSAPPSAVTSASPLEHSQFQSVAQAVAMRSESHEAEILVIVRSSNQRPVSDLARSIRLTDRSGERQRPLTSGDVEKDRVSQVATRRFIARPGSNVLSFEGSKRHRLEQTVHAFAGRQTIVFLKYGSLLISEKLSSGPDLKPRRGIDPTQTTIVSVSLARNAPDNLDERGRLADILLHKLAVGEPLRDESLLDAVKRDEDPFLKLYSAALLASRGEPDGSDLNDALLLTDSLRDDGVPDAACIRWRLLELGERGNGSAGTALDMPPMLDACWRWASAHSVAHPEDIRPSPIISAAARTVEPTPPWLVWEAAAKAQRRPSSLPPTSVAADVAELTRQIVNLVTKQAETSLPAFLNRQLADLSPATVEYANAAISVLSGDRALDVGEIARRIASSTGTPSPELAPQLDGALQELKAAAST
jgi:hypothetical protein